MKSLSLASLFLLAFLSGCVIDTSTHTERSGRHVSRETLEQIQVGRTPEFVLSLLGEPSSRGAAGDKTEVWKWEYRSRDRNNSTLIFVFDSDKTTEVRSTTYVLFEGGKVAKAWQD